MSIKLNFDAGSHRNPGLSGAGYVIYDQRSKIAHGYHYIGHATNNKRVVPLSPS